MSPRGPHLQVVCALIEEEGRVLVAQRAATRSLPLKWEFPGGKIESGESEAEALIREIREELGVDIEVGRVLGSVTHVYPAFRITLHPRLCSLVAGNPMPREHAAIEWSAPEGLRQRDWAPADLPILEEYLRLREFEGEG